MSLLLFHTLPILLYIIMGLLLVHLAWNAFAIRHWTNWLMFVGCMLLVFGVVAPLIRPTHKFQERNARTGAEVFGPDEPYWTCVQATEIVGALLIIGGLGAEVGKRIVGICHRRDNGRGFDEVQTK